jgi:hypothetical protein
MGFHAGAAHEQGRADGCKTALLEEAVDSRFDFLSHRQSFDLPLIHGFFYLGAKR